jgi:hypothetical protein
MEHNPNIATRHAARVGSIAAVLLHAQIGRMPDVDIGDYSIDSSAQAKRGDSIGHGKAAPMG